MNQELELELFQLHYYLKDEVHSMDAKIYNRVESQLIKIVEEISDTLGLELSVEVQALEEGGIRSIYRFKKQLIQAGIFVSGIMATVLASTIDKKVNADPEMDKILKDKARVELDHEKVELENAKLVTEKLKLEIQKLKKEASETEKEEKEKEELEINKEIIDIVAYHIANQNKVKISKSNLYRFLSQESKVEKISTQAFNNKSEPVLEENYIKREEFLNHIIDEIKIEPLYESNVSLEIVSPVLLNNRMNWKAIYNDEYITFSLKDKHFKKLITSKNLQFSTGTIMICDIETKQKMNSEGQIIQAGKSVYGVTKIIYTDGVEIDI